LPPKTPFCTTKTEEEEKLLKDIENHLSEDGEVVQNDSSFEKSNKKLKRRIPQRRRRRKRGRRRRRCSPLKKWEGDSFNPEHIQEDQWENKAQEVNFNFASMIMKKSPNSSQNLKNSHHPLFSCEEQLKSNIWDLKKNLHEEERKRVFGGNDGIKIGKKGQIGFFGNSQDSQFDINKTAMFVDADEVNPA